MTEKAVKWFNFKIHSSNALSIMLNFWSSHQNDFLFDSNGTEIKTGSTSGGHFTSFREMMMSNTLAWEWRKEPKDYFLTLSPAIICIFYEKLIQSW